MPELPEVETVARGLQIAVAGRTILSVTLGKTDFIDDPAAMERELPGTRIERVERYGKFMLLRLAARDSDTGLPRALLVHLGMTGNLVPSPTTAPVVKHTHVTFALDDGRELRFVDPRRFGRLAYLAGAALEEELTRFGAEPLTVTADEFAARMQGSDARIKALLLDQAVLRGVGNIYADESLWKAKIHPAKKGSQLKREETDRLLKELKKILLKAIALRGSSISDFVDTDGYAGEYQQHHKVYGRDGEKCSRCGATIRWMIVAGRSSHYCPVCQRAPRAGNERRRMRRGKKAGKPEKAVARRQKAKPKWRLLTSKA
jgi:formamidopyrimidine-DNA glycosylase